MGIEGIGAGALTVIDGSGMTGNLAAIGRHAVPRLVERT